MNIVIIILVLIIVILLFIKNRKEHLTNDEALSNISSLYNSQKLTATNMLLTGNLDICGNITSNNIRYSNNSFDISSNNFNLNSNNVNMNSNNINLSSITSTDISSNRIILSAPTINLVLDSSNNLLSLGSNLKIQNNKVFLSGLDIREYLIGCSLYNSSALTGNTGGDVLHLKPGYYNLQSLNNDKFINTFNNSIDAIQVMPGYRVRLWDTDRPTLSSNTSAMEIRNLSEYPVWISLECSSCPSKIWNPFNRISFNPRSSNLLATTREGITKDQKVLVVDSVPVNSISGIHVQVCNSLTEDLNKYIGTFDNSDYTDNKKTN